MVGRKPKTSKQKEQAAEFGKLVRAARKRAGVSEAVLAERVKVHRVTISRIENGHTQANAPLRRAIAKELNFQLLSVLDPSRARELLEELLPLGEDEKELLRLEEEAQDARRKVDEAKAELAEIERVLDYARRRTQEEPAAQLIAQERHQARARVGEPIMLSDTNLFFFPEVFEATEEEQPADPPASYQRLESRVYAFMRELPADEDSA